MEVDRSMTDESVTGSYRMYVGLSSRQIWGMLLPPRMGMVDSLGPSPRGRCDHAYDDFTESRSDIVMVG